MSLGALLGHGGFTMPGIEQGIAATVFVLGLLIAASVRLPVAAGMALVGLFALFHGLAHGAEMPVTTGGLAFGFGFVAATALLHLAGLGLGIVALRRSVRLARYTGWAIATAGMAVGRAASAVFEGRPSLKMAGFIALEAAVATALVLGAHRASSTA